MHRNFPLEHAGSKCELLVHPRARHITYSKPHGFVQARSASSFMRNVIAYASRKYPSFAITGVSVTRNKTDFSAG